MKSTVSKAIALVMSVMFLFFTIPGLPVSALDNPDKGKAVFDENIPPDSPLPDFSEQREKKEHKSKAHQKLATQLLQLVDPEMLPEGETKAGLLKQLDKMNMVTYGNEKSVDAAMAKVYIKLQPGAEAASLGSLAEVTNKDADSNLVVADVAVGDLEALAELDAVVGVQPVMAPIVYKVNTSEGVGMHNVDDAINAGANSGAGIKVGVISDGVDNLASAVASGDLPNNVRVVNNDLYHFDEDYNPETHPEYDEGTAMLEIIYDMAPGVELYFSDCGENQLAFNESIDDLVAAGCTVIVDDIGWILEPFFEDGVVAKHVQQLIDAGNLVYVSSAGNSATEHYQGLFYSNGNNKHDFSRGKDASFKQLYVALDPGEYVIAVLQWNDYGESSSNDYDMFLVNRANLQEVAWSNQTQNGNDDPIEAFMYVNTTKSSLSLAIDVELYSGVAKTLELYLYPGYGTLLSSKNIVTSNSIFGHAAAPGVITCGAIDHATPTKAESFSSQGPVTLVNGSTRRKPEVCGADGVSVTGAGSFPSHFYGTSAAAPHVAAIAALVWSNHPGFTPQQVRDRILNNAVDLGTSGFDNIYGYGRADAYYSVMDFYTVAFNTNGGSAVTSKKVVANGKVSQPATTRVGATLVGWFTDSGFTDQWDFANDVVTGNITLYAKWEVNKYTVSFNSCGGSVVDSLPNVEHGSTITAPAAPTRAGYTLSGWFKDAACTVAWNFSTSTVTGNTTLYAKWYAAAPLNVRAKSAAYNIVRVAWDASPAAPDIEGYEVWRASSATGTYTKVATVNGSTITVLNTGLTTNAPYYYKVRAYYTSGSRVIAGYFSAATAGVRPILNAPASCVADPVSYSSVKVVWGAVAGASGYEVYRASSSTGTYTMLTSTTATSYTNTGLVTGSAYYYKVRAYRTINGAKVYGAFSVVDGARPTLGVPASVRAYRASATSIKVTWGGVTGASGYELWRSTSSTGTYVLVKATTDTYFTNTGLATGQWYYYKVRAYRTITGRKVYSAFSGYSAARP